MRSGARSLNAAFPRFLGERPRSPLKTKRRGRRIGHGGKVVRENNEEICYQLHLVTSPHFILYSHSNDRE